MESRDESGASMMRSRVERVMEELRSASSEFLSQLKNDSETKNKRSIFVAVTELFSTVISGIKNLFSYQEIKNVQENSKHLTIQFNELSKNQELVIENQKYLSDKVLEIESKLHLTLFIDEFVSRVNHNIEILQKFTKAMISLHQGLVPVSIFTNSDADLVFRNLKDQASKQGKTLAIDTGIKLFGAKTSFFLANETLEIWQHVMCYDRNKRFSLFEQIDLPLVKNGESFSIDESMRFIATTEGLDFDKKVVVMKNLENCQEFSERSFLCQDLTIWKNYDDICIANLFLSDSTEHCKIIPVETKNRYTYTYDNLLVFGFPKPSEIVEICDNGVKYSTLTGIFKYDLKPNCELHTENFFIRGKFDAHFETNLTRKTLMIPKNENKKFNPPKKDKKFHEISYNSTFIEFEIIDNHDIAQYVTHVVIAIVVFGIIGFLIMKSRKMVTIANNNV